MNLEYQVVSLELAKKLKELGVKQESLFYHGYPCCEEDSSLDIFQDDEYLGEKVASAFTVAELGEMISWNVNDYEWLIHIAPKFSIDGSWVLWFEDEDGKKKRMFKNGDWYIADRKEADARAAMLIYLIENNLITNP